jgi:hypothetical protein
MTDSHKPSSHSLTILTDQTVMFIGCPVGDKPPIWFISATVPAISNGLDLTFKDPYKVESTIVNVWDPRVAAVYDRTQQRILVAVQDHAQHSTEDPYNVCTLTTLRFDNDFSLSHSFSTDVNLTGTVPSLAINALTPYLEYIDAYGDFTQVGQLLMQNQDTSWSSPKAMSSNLSGMEYKGPYNTRVFVPSVEQSLSTVTHTYLIQSRDNDYTRDTNFQIYLFAISQNAFNDIFSTQGSTLWSGYYIPNVSLGWPGVGWSSGTMPAFAPPNTQNSICFPPSPTPILLSSSVTQGWNLYLFFPSYSDLKDTNYQFQLGSLHYVAVALSSDGSVKSEIPEISVTESGTIDISKDLTGLVGSQSAAIFGGRVWVFWSIIQSEGSCGGLGWVSQPVPDTGILDPQAWIHGQNVSVQYPQYYFPVALTLGSGFEPPTE